MIIVDKIMTMAKNLDNKKDLDNPLSNGENEKK